ncbi:MAG TPA: ribonuclease III [Clostridiaceae bacterium]
MKLSYNFKTSELEALIDLSFIDKSLLVKAITHSSYAKQKNSLEYYERLEFLGDSVLQLSVSDYLYINFPQKSEGELTRLRALIVCENSLYEIAMKWKLGNFLLLSKGEELTGGRHRVSILADCVESIIAAVYIDKGFSVAKDFIDKNFIDFIKSTENSGVVLDYKTKLQELLQKKGPVSIEYKISKFDGPPHKRKFYMEVYIDTNLFGSGYGFSKKEAEQAAAKNALEGKEIDERS